MTNEILLQKLNNMENKINFLIDIVKSNGINLNIQSKCNNTYNLYSWLGEWYSVYKVPKLKPNSLLQIRICIDKHIKPHIQDMPLNNLKAIKIQKAMNKINSNKMRK